MSTHTIHAYGGEMEVSRELLAELGEKQVQQMLLSTARSNARKEGWTVLPDLWTINTVDDPFRERADTTVVMTIVLRVYKP